MKDKVFVTILFCVVAFLSKAQVDSSYTYFKLILRNFKKSDYYLNCNNTIKETFVVSKLNLRELVILCKIPNTSLYLLEENNNMLDSINLINIEIYCNNRKYFGVETEKDTVQGVYLIYVVRRKYFVGGKLYQVKRDQVTEQFEELYPEKLFYIRRHISFKRRKYLDDLINN